MTAGELSRENERIQVLTPSPSPSPDPTPSPEPTYNPDDPYGLVRPQPTEEGFLPIFNKANTEEMQIAIILDECSGSTITTRFAQEAIQHGAKLTLFPSGENVMKKGMDDVLKSCFYTYGFEIENRCYSTSAKLYTLNDTMMASEIWKQSISVSYVLGVRLHSHFLRLYGRDGENDLRTHTYLAQEGYKGIVGWTYNGSRMEEGRIGNNLAPGNIYYFKSTEPDLQRMSLLMDEARQQGYQMVTLNELFGYDTMDYEERANVLAEDMPELAEKIPYYFMKTGDCTWATNLLQHRLIELGYQAQADRAWLSSRRQCGRRLWQRHRRGAQRVSGQDRHCRHRRGRCGDPGKTVCRRRSRRERSMKNNVFPPASIPAGGIYIDFSCISFNNSLYCI